jgi:putative nucleotidyltransferase with HDIG domain
VLAVDDEAETLKMLGECLMHCGYRAFTSPSGEDALRTLAGERIDLMLTDVRMPGMSGLDLLSEVARKYPEVVSVVMTAFGDMATAREAIDRGASDFLVKPFSLLEVPVIVERNLRRTAVERGKRSKERSKLLLAAIKALGAAMDAKEHQTAEHSRRIAELAKMIASKLGLPEDQIEMLERASYLHDIGKIGVRESILLKPSELSDEEWSEMKNHPGLGSKIVSEMSDLGDIAHIILHHHERYDGNGYPQGLAGEDIPMLARILAVADAFDAMISDRPYRKALPEEKALERLKEEAGNQFDPKVVDAFLDITTQDLRQH